MEYLNINGEFEDSRNGKVLVAPVPICTATEKPMERVLFSQIRDANPFFHMFEALWMLCGRQDGRILDYFIKDFRINYAEPNGSVHGAYGYRWRYHFGFDQLDAVVKKLNAFPHDRQCVLQMWDCSLIHGNDLLGNWKDRPCNDIIFLRNNENHLDLTVCCRSNDMIWGAHGSNAVHFSILQEYLAARCDLSIGTMYQISNNAHAYLAPFNKMVTKVTPAKLLDDRYEAGLVKPMPMFDDIENIDEDIYDFCTWCNAKLLEDAVAEHVRYKNKWFNNVALPAMMALHAYKKEMFDVSLNFVRTIEAEDWRAACEEWILRRVAWK